MYTFNPVADIPVSHDGFVLVTALCVVMLIMVLFNEADAFFVWFFIACFPVGIAYGVSYHWTDQTPKTFANEKVTAQWVGYQPEGYREKSGKSYVDKHFVYVVYSVNGNEILLQGQAGIEYPRTAVLYKN